MKTTRTILILLVVGCETSQAWMLFSSSLPLRRSDTHTTTPALSAVASRGSGSSSSRDNPRQLPPGRPVGFLKSLFCDDTLKLLNPKTMASYQLDRKQQFGPVFRTNIFFRPAVCVVDEVRVQQLAAYESSSSLQAFFPPHHQKLFGKHSILVVSGPAHKRVRIVVAQSLAPQAMQGSEPLIQSAMEEFLNGLTTTSTTSTKTNNSNDYVALVPKLRKFFISLTLQLVLGTSTAPAEDLALDLERWSQGLLAAPLTFVPWSTAAKALRSRKRIAQRFSDILQTKPTKGLLGLLLQAKDENGNTLSEDDIIDNVLTIAFAGSDTTASAAISILKALHLNPKLRESLSDDNEEKLEAFVGSVLQSYPPAPFSMRVAQEELSLGVDYKVPANWLVLYGLAGTLLSSSIAATATTGTPSSPAASLAFGAGARKCPGRFLATLELKVWVRSLLRRQWELDANQDLEQRYRPGLFPNDDMKVKFVS